LQEKVDEERGRERERRRRREGGGKQGKLISTALAHEVVHTEKKRRRAISRISRAES